MNIENIQPRAVSSKPSVKAMVLRYRIWAYAAPMGWNVTVQDIADALNDTPSRIATVLHLAGWTHRIRVSRHDQRAIGGGLSTKHLDPAALAGVRFGDMEYGE